MHDGVIILDDHDSILYLNQAAEGLLGKGADASYQKRLSEVMRSFPARLLAEERAAFSEKGEAHELVKGRYFEIQCSPIRDPSEGILGKLVILRGLTEQRKAEREALQANLKLDLLSSITRHDVLNQLTVIEGHLALVRLRTEDKEILYHIDASLGAKRVIERQISFFRDYQGMRNQARTWQDVETAFMEAGRSLVGDGVRLSADAGRVELLADPLLTKVLYNLIDNSLAHGERVSSISLSAEWDGDGLRLLYEDDGVGVPTEHKEKIFERGFGKKTGFGMFLSKEILAISGMSIVEDRELGRGARFVISVPPGHYRFPLAS
jgi:signal transduction histidine kinase